MMYVKIMSGETIPDHMPGKSFMLIEVPSGCIFIFEREMIQAPYIEEMNSDGSIIRVARKYKSEEERKKAFSNTRPKLTIKGDRAFQGGVYYPKGNTYVMNEKGDTVATFHHRKPD